MLRESRAAIIAHIISQKLNKVARITKDEWELIQAALKMCNGDFQDFPIGKTAKYSEQKVFRIYEKLCEKVDAKAVRTKRTKPNSKTVKD